MPSKMSDTCSSACGRISRNPEQRTGGVADKPSVGQPDQGGHATSDFVSPMGEETPRVGVSTEAATVNLHHPALPETLAGELEQVGQPFARPVGDECGGCICAPGQERVANVGANLEGGRADGRSEVGEQLIGS